MIKSISLENWRSHKNSRLEFGPGTNVLVGVLGSGKSSVMDALCFALFGTFPALNARRVSMDEVVMNRPGQEEKAKVKAEFGFAGEEYAVERTINLGKKANEAKLKKNGELIAGPKPSEVTERIEELLEMNYELFSRAVYSEQNQIDFFLRLSPSQRKEKFDELLDLEKYETARGNAVQLKNRLKKENRQKGEWLNQLKERFSLGEMEKQKKSLGEREVKLRALEKELKEWAGEKKEKEKRLREIESKKKEFSLLSDLTGKMEGRIEGVEKDLRDAEKEAGEELKAGIEELAGKMERLERKKAESEKKAEWIAEKEKEKAVLMERKEGLEKEIESIQKAVMGDIGSFENLEKRFEESVKEIMETEKGVERLEEECGKARDERRSLEQGITETEKQLRELEESGAKCPVCEAELGEGKKESILKEKRKRLEEKNSRRIKERELEKGIKKELEEKKKLFEELREQNRKLVEAKEKGKGIEEKSREIRELNALLRTVSLELEKESSGEVKERIKGIDGERKKLEKLIQCKSREKEVSALKNELKGLERKLKELEFSEKEYGKRMEAKYRAEEKVKGIEKEIFSVKEFVSALRDSLKALEKTRMEIEKEENFLGERENALEGLGVFAEALSATQAQLRKQLVEAVNEAMADVWERVYPYKDFSSAKMVVEEGSYELKVRDRKGKWVRVEGILSGGERSAAAICIRIAFSLVLTRNLGLLILDEPTHNLDKNAVDSLSEMMKSHLPELVEQIFIITHDPEMEKSASSSLYTLERNKETDGATISKRAEI